LRLGCVKYLNARPLVHGWEGDLLLDHPSVLCRKLAQGDLDAALVSSIEYLRNPTYKIVDDVSIASDGPVFSVVVVHSTALADVAEISLDPASETSVVLLRYLLRRRGLNPRLIEGGEVVTAGASVRAPAGAPASSARLLIGDQAIRFRLANPDLRVWDLGQEWKEIMHLPFVYALWLVRPQVIDPRQLAERLRALRTQNLARMDELIAQEQEFDHEFCRRYYRDHLRFGFGEREKKGLQNFAEVCVTQNLIPPRAMTFNLV
jgi:chorismate dehydratase